MYLHSTFRLSVSNSAHLSDSTVPSRLDHLDCCPDCLAFCLETRRVSVSSAHVSALSCPVSFIERPVVGCDKDSHPSRDIVPPAVDWVVDSPVSIDCVSVTGLKGEPLSVSIDCCLWQAWCGTTSLIDYSACGRLRSQIDHSGDCLYNQYTHHFRKTARPPSNPSTGQLLTHWTQNRGLFGRLSPSAVSLAKDSLVDTSQPLRSSLLVSESPRGRLSESSESWILKLPVEGLEV